MEVCFVCAGAISSGVGIRNGKVLTYWTHADVADVFNTPHDALPAVYLPDEQVYVLACGVAKAEAEDLR